MAAKVVRTDYDQLTQAAATFAQQAEQASKVYQGLRQTVELLQGGDWLGQGAQAFYSEMNGQVLPTMQRLVRALEQAAETTRKVNQIAQQAEREAAACLKVDGAGAGAAIGAAAAALGVDGAAAGAGAALGAAAAGLATGTPAAPAGPVGAGASAFVGGRADANGGGGAATKLPAPLKLPVEPKVNGAGDTKGQAAFGQYLSDYSNYLRQESQKWNWPTVEQKVYEQYQKSAQMARALDSQLQPVLRELFDKSAKGVSDPALRQRALDLIHQQSNALQKAQIERQILEQRAGGLLTEAEDSARGKVLTDAERQAKSKNLQAVDALAGSLQLNLGTGDFLQRSRNRVINLKP